MLLKIDICCELTIFKNLPDDCNDNEKVANSSHQRHKTVENQKCSLNLRDEDQSLFSVTIIKTAIFLQREVAQVTAGVVEHLDLSNLKVSCNKCYSALMVGN